MRDLPAETDRVIMTDVAAAISEWNCDFDRCTVEALCSACLKRAQVAKLLADRDLGLRPCSMDCSSTRPCVACREVETYLAWLFLERENLTPLLRALKRLAKAFPEELRELLAEPVTDIVAAAVEVES